MSGTLTCLLTDLVGGITSNPADGRRLLAMNDDVAPGVRTSYVRLPSRKGGTYYIGVDVDRVTPGGYQYITYNSTNATVIIPNVNIGLVQFSMDFIPEAKGRPNYRNLDPFVISQPQPVASIVTATNTFSVSVQGTHPITYQWRRNGVPLFTPSATSNTLSVANISLADVGNYTVRITDLFGSVISTPASLTILQPASLTVTAGNSATFSLIATGIGGLTYQWYRNGVIMPGETNSTLTFSTVLADNGNTYRVTVTDSYGRTATSPNATLTVM
jgi:hypothetical protein